MKYIIYDASDILAESIVLKKHRDIRNDRNSEPIGGTLEFLSIMRDLSSKFQDYHTIVCWDGGLNPYKLELDPSYKKYNKFFTESKSLSRDSDAIERQFYLRQKSIINDILDKSGIDNIEISGLEREDIISNIVNIDNNSEYIIVTEDEDIIVLLSNNISVYRPYEDTHVFYSSYVKNFQKEPSIEIQRKAITGDYLDMTKSSCPGIGSMYYDSLYKLLNIIGFDNMSNNDDKSIRDICEKNKIPFRKAYLNFNLDRYNINKRLYDFNFYISDNIINQINMMLSNLSNREIEITSLIFENAKHYIKEDLLRDYKITYRYSC